MATVHEAGDPLLFDDPRPELVGVWRSEDSVARKLALADHEEAMDLLLSVSRVCSSNYRVGCSRKLATSSTS